MKKENKMVSEYTAKLAYAKLFIKQFGALMRSSGLEAKAMGLSREETLFVWKKVLAVTLKGGGKYGSA
jgi:hypothetical protein